MPLLKFVFGLLLIFFCMLSCKKEVDIDSGNSQVQWMRVLTDSAISSTDDKGYMSTSGKVLTDDGNNIILYYYSKQLIKTTLVYCSAEGNPLWRKEFKNFVPLDITKLNDNRFVMAGYDSLNVQQGLKLYRIHTDGKLDSVLMIAPYVPQNVQHVFRYIYSCALVAMPDNSIRASGAFMPMAYNFHVNYFGKINSSFQFDWNRQINYLSTAQGVPPTNFASQHSLIRTSNNKFLYEWQFENDPAQTDSVAHGIIYGVINDGPIVSLDTSWLHSIFYKGTGYEDFSNGNNYGWINQYANGFLNDYDGDFIYHYSGPELLGNSSPAIASGFLRLDNEGKIKDTISIPLPTGYRIISCTQNNGRFLMTAYKSGIVSGTSDFSAEQTLFLTGGGDWRTTESFTLQNFYMDFFSSTAPTSDGGFVIMGKIQSFNRPANKLVLIKLKN